MNHPDPKPSYFRDHEIADEKQFATIRAQMAQTDQKRDEQHAEVMRMLQPISDVYVTVGTMRKWTVAFAVFVGIIVALLVGIKQLRY